MERKLASTLILEAFMLLFFTWSAWDRYFDENYAFAVLFLAGAVHSLYRIFRRLLSRTGEFPKPNKYDFVINSFLIIIFFGVGGYLFYEGREEMGTFVFFLGVAMAFLEVWCRRRRQ